MVSAALVTGNTVIMKPAEQSAVCGAMLMEMFEEAGIPPGVLNFLTGQGLGHRRSISSITKMST